MAGTGNIFADPELLNDFRLSITSPAVDKGNPLADRDPDGSLPDIGAYYLDIDDQKNIFINEINYNPPDGEEYEFIEIFNAGEETINLSGYRLSGDIDYTFDSFDLLPGAYFVVAKNLSSYSGQGFDVKQWQQGSLSDGYGNLVLLGNSGNQIDRVDYNSRYWWPEEPDGSGPSLELHDIKLENMISTSWRASYEDGGTPGRDNKVTLAGKLFINEFLAGNSSTNADENGEYDDWIEIFNTSENDINIGGLFVTDTLIDLTKNQIVFNSPDKTTIPANGKILLWADGQPEQGALHCNFRLNRAGEQIGLIQISETDTIIIDSVTFGEQTQDVSYGRYPDGSSNWAYFENPTPLDSNIITGVDDEDNLPVEFYLSQNYPNPFNPTTKIKYSIPVVETTRRVVSTPLLNVRLVVYDILGREVATLVDRQQRPGNYEVKWDAANFSSGIYFYRLTAGTYINTKKMILLK
jgi:hypothetical protein